jgi:hypothetical protein
MKKPNLEDFDVNARTRSLSSPLDGMPPIVKPQATQGSAPVQNSQPIAAIPERPTGRTTVRANGKRIITRNSFEIYEDQMDSLRERSFQDKRQGGLGSMSAMVREAIDDYLQKHPPRD